VTAAHPCKVQPLQLPQAAKGFRQVSAGFTPRKVQLLQHPQAAKGKLCIQPAHPPDQLSWSHCGRPCGTTSSINKHEGFFDHSTWAG